MSKREGKNHHGFVDHTGAEFGRLKVMSITSQRIRRMIGWLCQCSCGKTTVLPTSKIGVTMSCGCLQRDESGSACRRRTRHGSTKSPTWISWQSMKSRCLNKNDPSYFRYGGAGVSIYAPWIESFEEFVSHVGERPSRHSLDRYPNSNGNYEPGNVRWATALQQSNNRHNSILVEHHGKMVSLPTLSKLTGINCHALRYRHEHGLDLLAPRRRIRK